MWTASTNINGFYKTLPWSNFRIPLTPSFCLPTNGAIKLSMSLLKNVKTEDTVGECVLPWASGSWKKKEGKERREEEKTQRENIKLDLQLITDCSWTSGQHLSKQPKKQ